MVKNSWCRERGSNPRPSDVPDISGAWLRQCLDGCPMSPTRYQLRHPGGDQTTHGPVFKDAARTDAFMPRSPLPAPWTLSAERLPVGTSGSNPSIRGSTCARSERTPSRCGS